jgi:hypothetical protein
MLRKIAGEVAIMKNSSVKYSCILILAASSCAFAQDGGKTVILRSGGPVGPVALFGGGGMRAPGTPVQGAPYSATITNESVQTLADGNRIVQSSTGGTARDSQGRTRQDTVLPAIGNLSAANAPHLVFVQDPVAQTSYMLNLSDKTAQELPQLPPPGSGPQFFSAEIAGGVALSTGAPDSGPVIAGTPPVAGPNVTTQSGNVMFWKMKDAAGATTDGPVPPPLPPQVMAGKMGELVVNDQAQIATEDLGTKNIEGVQANGTRTTRTIPAGQIGNDKPISIVTEVWISPDLQTVVYSKRSDPRMGEQIFSLTNIVRGQPDPSLFTIPADFKIVKGPQPIVYKSVQ